MRELFGRPFRPEDVEYASSISITEILTGTVASVIAGYLATIPWILLAYFTGFFVGWLGYLIGIGALFGFVFGAGKVHKVTFIVITLVILTAIPLAGYAEVLLYTISEGFIIDPLSYILISLEPDLIQQTLFNTVAGYVIAFLGAFSILRSLRQGPVYVPRESE